MNSHAFTQPNGYTTMAKIKLCKQLKTNVKENQIIQFHLSQTLEEQ